MLDLIYYDLQSIVFKFESVFLSLTLLLVGFVYADKPIEIDCTVYINGEEISVGDNIAIPSDGNLDVTCKCENIGRPFEGISYHEPYAYFYKTENGEIAALSQWSYSTDEVRKPVLVKSGEIFTGSVYSNLAPDAEPGVYTLEISLYGHTQIYENVLTVV